MNILRCGGTNDVEAIKPEITLLPVRINGTKVVKTSSEFRHAKHYKVLHPLPYAPPASSTTPLWLSENPYSIHSLLSSSPTDTIFVWQPGNTKKKEIVQYSPTERSTKITLNMVLQKQRSRSTMFIYSTARSLKSWLRVSLEVWVGSQHPCPMHFKGLAIGGEGPLI